MAKGDSNQSRPLKATRRKQSDMDNLRHAIVEALKIDKPMTVRQVFYRLVCNGVIDKHEGEYGGVVSLLTRMREDGQVPYEWIADNTRMMRKPKMFSRCEDALRHTAESYRRQVWDDQESYVEVWLEKEALAGVLHAVTEPWGVPLMVTRGYSSVSFLHAAGTAIKREGKPTTLYYFGDHDPSGLDISRNTDEGIRRHAPGIDITFRRVAVTPEQIEEFSLPTRPTKKSDSRSRGFEGGSVEVDAIPPRQLRQMAQRCITDHIDTRSHEAMKGVEAAERETLRGMADLLDRRIDPAYRDRRAEDKEREMREWIKRDADHEYRQWKIRWLGDGAEMCDGQGKHEEAEKYRTEMKIWMEADDITVLPGYSPGFTQ